MMYHLFNYLQVYICGGFSGAESLSKAEGYNPQTDQWTLIASMGSRRSGLGVIAYAGQIFAVSSWNTADTHMTQKHCETQRHEKMSLVEVSDWTNIHRVSSLKT